MEEKITQLESEIEAIKERNRKVEANKAWETSMFRIIAITLITYLVATVVLHFIGVPDIFFNALIPTIGFILSVQSLPIIKKWWITRYLKRK